jgi:hypothetical protein
MSIIRVKHDKNNPYFQLNRAACQDRRLSWKAVGIHTYLMSKPDDWTINEVDLARRHKDGTTSVRSGLQELKDCGYVEVVAVKSENQRIVRWETIVYETPQERPETRENPETGVGDSQNVGNPQPGKPTDRETHSQGNTPLVSKDFNDQSFPNGKDLKEKQREPSPPTADDTPPPVNGRFFPDGEEGHRAGKAKDYAAQAAEDLARALDAKKLFIGRRKPALPAWAKTFREFLALGEITQAEFDAVLRWYIEHIGERFVPEAHAASTFLEKFVKIRKQMEWQNNPRGQGKKSSMDDAIEEAKRLLKERQSVFVSKE